MAARPVLMRLERRSLDRLVVTSGGKFAADCWQEDGVWNIALAGGRVATMTVSVDRGGCVVLTESPGTVMARISRSGAAYLLSDAEGMVNAILRPDSTGSLSAISPNGSALLFAGRSSSPATLDVLVTDAGVAYPRITLFALLASVELSSELFTDFDQSESEPHQRDA